MNPSVEVSGLSVNYGPVKALEQVSFTLNSGSVTGLIGMNGSGKSTLFKAIMGLVAPASGQVLLGGLEPGRARKNGLISYIPQSENVDLNFPLRVHDIVMMGRYRYQGPTRRPRPADRQAVAQALEKVGLTDLASRQIGQLSGGQLKRAFLARSIATEAPIMLLDEPFSGVDKASEATIVALLRELAAGGRTVFVSTHDLANLGDLASQALVLLHKILFRGPVAQALDPEILARAFGLETGSPDFALNPADREPAFPKVGRVDKAIVAEQTSAIQGLEEITEGERPCSMAS